MKKNFHLFGLLSIGCLVAVFFYQTFLFGRLPVPVDTLVGLYHPWRDLYASTNPRGVPFKNFLITDPVRQQIPWRKMGIEAWKSGHMPSWNPYNFLGTRLDANIQAAVFYPFNILFFIFQFPVAWSILVMLQPLCAGMFLYLYLRHLTLSPIASLLGAISWSFGGFSVAWMTWGTMMQTVMWLPLILLSLDKLLTQTEKFQIRRWTVVSILAIVMLVLAGHAQIAIYALITGWIYWIWRYRSLTVFASHNGRPKPWTFIVGISTLFSAIAWLPFLQFLPETVRLTVAEGALRPGWFLPWQNLIQFVAPDFFGNPATLNYWGVWNYGEFIGYIGLLPLILALSVLFSGGVATFWSSIVVAGLFFMLNHSVTVFLQWINLPILSVLQPTRLMAVVDLGLAILAAYGMDEMLKGKHGQRVRRAGMTVGICIGCLWIVVMTGHLWAGEMEMVQNLVISRRNLILPTILYAIAAIFLLYGFRGKRIKFVWLAGIMLIASFDVFRFGWKFTSFTDPKFFFPTTKVIEYLQSQPKPFRIASLDDRIFPPNVSGYYGLESVEGYDPLTSRRFEEFLRVSESGKAALSGKSGFNRIYVAHNIDSVLFPYFNAHYVLSLQDQPSPKLKLVFTEGETKVYKYINALPRVYLAQDLTVITEKTAENVLDAVLKTSSESIQSAVLEQPVSVLSVPLGSDEIAYITSYDPYQISVTTETLNSRLLVVLNKFDEKTRVTIDGQNARLERVNYLFSGVVVPAGTHKIVLNY